MICEGTLKTGDIIKSNGDDYKIVYQHLEGIFNSIELGSSMLASKSRLYTISQKPVTFIEAINSGKRIRCIHDRYFKSDQYMTISEMFKSLSTSPLVDFIPTLINEGKWYIEESEADSND